jgi:hypothetical protein
MLAFGRKVARDAFCQPVEAETIACSASTSSEVTAPVWSAWLLNSLESVGLGLSSYSSRYDLLPIDVPANQPEGTAPGAFDCPE